MESVDRSDDDPDLLTEHRLKHMSRHIRSVVPQQNDSESTEDSINALRTTIEEIFFAASRPKLTASHRVAAWNTLCAVIDQCAVSQSQTLRDYIWDEDVWERSFTLYLNQSSNTRPKSSKQLLSTLSSTLKKKDCTTNIRLRLGKSLVKSISDYKDPSGAKACLQVLAHFFGREVLALDDVLSCLDGTSHAIDRTNAEDRLQTLLAILFQWAGEGDLGSIVGQVVSVVLDKAPIDMTDSNDRAFHLWAGPLGMAIHGNDVKIDDLPNHIFPVLFKRSSSDYMDFLEAYGLHQLSSRSLPADFGTKHSSHAAHDVLYAALQTGKEMGLLYETDRSEVSQTATSVSLPLRTIDRLLCSSSRTARLTGLSLLIKSHTMTRPFPKQTFEILRRRLSIFFADTDANFRGELFSSMQKLLDRMRAISAVLARQSSGLPSAASTLQEHQTFLQWLLRFLNWELRPTASYQRHITALRTLLAVVRSGVDDAVPIEFLSKSARAETKWPFHLPVMNFGTRRLLLDLLLDPFDDVRQIAAMILSTYAMTCDDSRRKDVSKELAKTIDRAEKSMLATGRADQADGVAHLYSLLFRHCDSSQATSKFNRSSQQQVLVHLAESLEQMLDIANNSLAKAVNHYPMHGLLTSLQKVLTSTDCSYDFGRIPDRLINSLHQVWRIVKPVLCDDAPEGYMIEVTEEMPDTSTKDLLSYCWRALKESSSLLHVIVSQASLAEGQSIEISNLCFTQLVELRHRGAFSTVAQTWITCCMRCNKIKGADGQMMLHTWYERALRILSENVTINTRRSAGLPSLICGLLIADGTESLFSHTIHDLTSIARQPVDIQTMQESSLPHVHAINCIKDILKNSRLGELSEHYVPKALILAAGSLRSDVWAIRNCGLMLFRAVIDRLHGTSESHVNENTRSAQRVSVQQHPQMLDAILGLLKVAQGSRKTFVIEASEGVFPALQLLQKIQIPEHKSCEVQAAVYALTASASWHIRDKAARVYAAIINVSRAKSEIERLLLSEPNSHNSLHGNLLCVKSLIVQLQSSLQSNAVQMRKTNPTGSAMARSNDVQDCLSTVASTCHLYYKHGCPVTKAAFIDILAECLQHRWSGGIASDNDMEQYHKEASNGLSGLSIFQELELSLDSRYQGAGEAILRRSLVRAFVYELSLLAKRSGSEIDETVALMLKLARSDTDTCCSMFADIRCFNLFSAYLPSSACMPLLLVCSRIFEGCYNMKLKCELQRFLLYLSDQHLLSNDRTQLAHIYISACESASALPEQDATQLYADQCLQLQAVAFECRLNIEENLHQDLGGETANLICHCNAAIQLEESDVYTREAAALAVSRFRSLWDLLMADNLHSFCNLCFAVYDLLKGDDEDTRLLAADITCRILGYGSKTDRDSTTIEPITAGQKLLRFMIKRWSGEDYFATKAFDRAFDVSTFTADRVSASSTHDTTLFAEEKQNLYVDEATEAKTWSQVVLALHPSSIPRRLIAELAWWVQRGLNDLLRDVGSDVDGPLGWSANPDVFKLGLQILYGAEFLLHAADSGVNLPIRPSQLRLYLRELSESARTHKVNCLWIYEMDRILKQAVLRKLGQTKRLLDIIASI